MILLAILYPKEILHNDDDFEGDEDDFDDK
jgi:hypothetical protein